MAKKKLAEASIVRSLVKRYAKRQIKLWEELDLKERTAGAKSALNDLIGWLEGQPKRTAAKKGGIGRGK